MDRLSIAEDIAEAVAEDLHCEMSDLLVEKLLEMYGDIDDENFQKIIDSAIEIVYERL